MMKLKPIAYKWKDRVRTHYGFKAQHIGKLIKRGVIEDFGGYIKDGDVYAMRYNELIAPLVKSIQELKTQLNELAEIQTPNQRKKLLWLK